MSTPDQPETPPLTRRQLREIRNTGATPVPTPEEIAKHAAASVDEPQSDPQQTESDAPSEADATSEPVSVEESSSTEGVELSPGEEPPAEDEPRAAEEPQPEDAQPAGESGHVQPEQPHAPAVEDSTGSDSSDAGSDPMPVEAGIPPETPAELGVAPLTRRQAREQERIRTASVPIITPDTGRGESDEIAARGSQPEAESAASAPAGSVDDAVDTSRVIDDVPGVLRQGADLSAADVAPSALVDPQFGSGLLAGDAPVVTLPPSFDQLIARSASSGGSSSTPNALILSQTPAAAPLDAPVTATGEVLITGTFDLPEGLGSAGHVPGLHDGKDVDAVLVDGELPAASSPTPVAASAAISTVRTSDEIIRPPAPEKGSRLVLVLGIVTGVLGLAAISAFVLAFTTGAL